MDTITLNGKRYIKASSAARETGYTMDYIGQMCRKKKVDAQLVGRTWYVLETDLHDHRRTKGRTNTARVQESVRKAISENTEKRALHPTPEYRKRLTTEPVRYSTDASDLLPALAPRHIAVVSKDKEVDVTPSTQQETVVRVTSEESSAHLDAVHVKHHQVKWNGTIVVAPLEDQVEVEPEKVEQHVELLSEDKSERVKIHTEPEQVVIETTSEEQEMEIPVPVLTAKPSENELAPTFTDRLNHAHILNETSEEVTTAEELVAGKLTISREVQKPGLVTNMLVGTVAVASIIFTAPTLALERVVHIQRDVSGYTERRVMSSSFALISLKTVQAESAVLISSVRNIAINKDFLSL